MNETEFVTLDGWLSVADAAVMLDVSRQAIHAQIQRGTYTKVGVVPTGATAKPFYLLPADEVRALVKGYKVDA